MSEYSIVSWNILYDKEGYFKNAGPQVERSASHIEALKGIGITPDLVGLVEVQEDAEHGIIGDRIAQAVAGVNGHWAAHSRKDELLGMFGPEITEVQEHALEDNRSMMTTQIGDVTVGLVHFTFGLRGEARRVRQMQQALKVLAESEKAILMGDFNSAGFQRSRRLVERAGYRSVFEVLGVKRPATVLTGPYLEQLSPMYKYGAKRGLAPDDIYVRNIDVKAAGVFEGDSDHRGIWATLFL